MDNTTTTIILKAAGPCDIELGFLVRCHDELKALAQKVEQRLKPKLKRKETILWVLTYFLKDDEPEDECLNYPTIECQVYLLDKRFQRSAPFKILHPGRAPMIFNDQFEPVYDADTIVEQAVQSLCG